MKILYGVQATGNGHISRARAMNKELKKAGIDVDFVFSGRPFTQFFDMEEFGDWQCFKGLTFTHEAGDLKVLKTLKNNNPLQFWRDINSLNVDQYDVVLTDFEPITAWACKRQGKTCIGMGHQYAFNHHVPRRGDDFVPRTIMKNFAPTEINLGLHWHHFGQQILPPIAETHETKEFTDPNKIVVYLGFEDAEEVINLLEPFDQFLFAFYGPFPQYESRGHIQLKPLSREGFKQDLATAGGVISNAGFELSSEAIQLGKKLLIKPLKGQMEQLSNAEAIEQLGLGMTMDTLDHDITRKWLNTWEGKKVSYPNVSAAITQWLAQGEWKSQTAKADLVNQLWSEVKADGVPSFEKEPLPPSLSEANPLGT